MGKFRNSVLEEDDMDMLDDSPSRDSNKNSVRFFDNNNNNELNESYFSSKNLNLNLNIDRKKIGST